MSLNWDLEGLMGVVGKLKLKDKNRIDIVTSDLKQNY